MITRAVAMTLKHGDILYHYLERTQAGLALTARVNGKCKTWKTRQDFILPMRIGWNTYFRISSVGFTPRFAEDPATWYTFDPAVVRKFPASVGLDHNAPWQIVYDRLCDAGRDEDARQWQELRS